LRPPRPAAITATPTTAPSRKPPKAPISNADYDR
jgi:hypothetical protein